MAKSPMSIRPAPVLIEAMENNGGGRGNAHRIAQIADRYLELLRRSSLPAFSKEEFTVLCEISDGLRNEPASTIRSALWTRLEGAIPSGITAKHGVDGEGLLLKLKKLSFVQEIALIERIEAAAPTASE